MLHFANTVLISYALSKLSWDVCALESTRTEAQSEGAIITQAPAPRNELQRRSAATCAYVRGNAGMCSSRGFGFFTVLRNADVIGL
jgi:hypothetical protein